MELEENILSVRNLGIHFTLDEGILKAVDGVSFDLKRNETVGIIGESGCGKSVTSQGILRTLQKPGKLVNGEILYSDGVSEVVDLAKEDPNGPYMRNIRGREISMIFQEPMASLGPIYSIGHQLTEAVLIHQRRKNKKYAREISLEMLGKVGIPNPKERYYDYPHQLSGGLCQRVLIALALVNRPKILIADEPTTALDVTVQAQIIDLMKQLQDDFKMSIIYISHNMGVIAKMADSIRVMYLGKIVESASTEEIFINPLHPYTRMLLKSIPILGKKTGDRLDAINGNVPVPIHLPAQCGFYSRCPDRYGRCGNDVPELFEASPGHYVRCFHCLKKG